MWGKITSRFEMSVRDSFKLYSQQLNSFVTLVVLPYIIASNGGFIGEMVAWLPATYRVIVAPFVGLAAFALVTWTRLYVQRNLTSGQ